MDIVGDAIRALRLGEPRTARAHLYGHWGLRFDPASGAWFHIHVVLQGNAWLVTDDDSPPIPLQTGDVLFISRELAYGLADEPTTPLVDVPQDPADYWFSSTANPQAHPGERVTVLLGGSYYLDRKRVHPLIHSLPDVFLLPARVGADDAVRATVDLLGSELDAERLGVTAAIPALMDLLLTYVIRSALDTPESSGGWAAALRDPALIAALDQMQTRPEVPWTVAGLAQVSGLSRAAFARRFAETVGQPPMGYLTWWRMMMAGRLLSDSDVPLSALSRQVGYGSEFAFGKAFRREFGSSPGAYRRSQREAPAARDRSLAERRRQY